MLWKRLDDRYEQLTKLDEEILHELRDQDPSQEEMDEEFDTVQEYRDKWNDLTQLNSAVVVRPQDDNRSSSASISQSGNSNYKLPKLKLVEFSGSPREWLTFWSQFKGIHERQKLSPEEKFQYLIQATVSESVARRVVCSFPPTAENYEKAIEHLTSRFGKEKVLVEVYVRDLLKLVLTNSDGKQRLSLAALYDQLATQLRALESLGVTSDKYAAMLYPLVESSLPEEVLVTWERIRNQRDLSAIGDIDQLGELMKFLQGEVESSIRLSMAKREVISDDESDDPPRKKIKTNFDTVTTMDLLNKSSVTITKCIFCGKLHESQLCISAAKLPLNKRFSRIREAGKCFRCLVGNHLSRNCRTSIKCTVCSGNHYKMLCNNNDKRPLNEINAASVYTGVGTVFSSKADLQLHTQIHMREAKPYKCSKCTKAFANSSYLSQHTRIHLGIKPYRCEICQRKFTQLSHLQQHIRPHTGDKPYKCRHPGCNKAFSQLSNLQSHSRCHQTDKPYKCNSCYKCFTDEASLLDHIPKHKESKHLKTHICNFCGKSYTQKTYLTKYMQKHVEKSEKRMARQNNNNNNSNNNNNHHQSNGKGNGNTNGQAHQVNNHQNSNSGNVLPSPEMYWGKADIGESSPPSMCLPSNGQGSILGRQGSEGPDDLRVNNLGQHHPTQPPTPTNPYDALANALASSKGASASAFTPIQTVVLNNSAMLQIPTNMTGRAPPGTRAYIPYEPLSFQKSSHHHQMTAMDMKAPGNAFPNQLISLHQIRNYAHQPAMTPEHLLGLKDK